MIGVLGLMYFWLQIFLACWNFFKTTIYANLSEHFFFLLYKQNTNHKKRFLLLAFIFLNELLIFSCAFCNSLLFVQEKNFLGNCFNGKLEDGFLFYFFKIFKIYFVYCVMSCILRIHNIVYTVPVFYFCEWQHKFNFSFFLSQTPNKLLRNILS